MKIVRFIVSAILAISITIALNTRFNPAPPLGKFLDPVNGFWANAEIEDHSMPEHVHFDGLNESVKVVYDDLLIPHIFAENDEDLYFTQGYLHAYHRLWQMEFQNLYAAGRVSEIVGDLALDYDRGQRRKGMIFGANHFLNSIESDPGMKMSVEQYTAGVNAYINSLNDKTLPFEYKLLDYKPEKWNMLKCAILLKYMSNMLNTGERDLENTNFLAEYGRDYLDLIYPDVDNYKDAVVENNGQWGFDPIQTENESTMGSDEAVNVDLLPKQNENNGSNNWAVSGSKSANGNALLSNDMHLSMYLPSLWYYNQLKAPGINVFGHSLMGVPSVITGFTDSIAWGFTNAQRDLVDWFEIEFKDDSMDEYFLDGEWTPTEKVAEEIGVRGQDSYLDTVVYTIFGPVVYDNNYRSDSEKKGYAMRWISHDPSEEFKMFFNINRAKNIDDFLNALKYHSAPAQNIVYADVEGNIAHKVQGRYPLKGFEEGKFLMDGRKSANNWDAYIPPEQNAYWFNPERGFVASANQHPADSTYPYYITSRVYESYRNRRINDVLRADSSVSVQDFKDLQYDNYSLKAAESLPLMLTYLDSANLNGEEEKFAESLRNWDYYFNIDSRGALVYDVWFDNLFISIWDEIQSSTLRLYYPTNYSTINLMHNQPDLDFFDSKSTDEVETLKMLIEESFKKSVEEIQNWESENEGSWAEYKGTFVRHFLQEPLGYYGIKAGGNGGDVVNASGSNHGPSERIIVELDPAGVKAWGHYPGGQSGNPGSIYYDNMVEAWAEGRYFNLRLLTSPDDYPEEIIFTQTLEAPHEDRD